MFLPYLLIQEENLFTTLQSDNAKEFIVKINPFLNASIYSLQNNSLINSNNESIKDFLFSLKCKETKHIIFSYNIIQEETKQILNELHKVLNQTKEEKISALINYLLLLHSFSNNFFHLSFSNVIDSNNKTTVESINKFNNNLKTDESIIYKNEKNNITILSNKIEYINSNLITFGMDIIDSKEKCDNIYYSIEIYGNKNYVILNQFIQDIERITGITIPNNYCKNIGEYNNAIQNLYS